MGDRETSTPMEINRGSTVWRFEIEHWGNISDSPRIVSGIVTAAGAQRCRVRWEGNQWAEEWKRAQLERSVYPTQTAALYGALSALHEVQAAALRRNERAAQALVAVREMILAEGAVAELREEK